MKLGLTEDHYKFLLKNLVLPLEQKGATVWAFGSRARGDHHTYSDLDIMIESATDVTREISRIKEFFSKSNFPYKVDLVAFDDFAESYKEGYFKDRQKLSCLLQGA